MQPQSTPPALPPSETAANVLNVRSWPQAASLIRLGQNARSVLSNLPPEIPREPLENLFLKKHHPLRFSSAREALQYIEWCAFLRHVPPAAMKEHIGTDARSMRALFITGWDKTPYLDVFKNLDPSKQMTELEFFRDWNLPIDDLRSFMLPEVVTWYDCLSLPANATRGALRSTFYACIRRSFQTIREYHLFRCAFLTVLSDSDHLAPEYDEWLARQRADAAEKALSKVSEADLNDLKDPVILADSIFSAATTGVLSVAPAQVRLLLLNRLVSNDIRFLFHGLIQLVRAGLLTEAAENRHRIESDLLEIEGFLLQEAAGIEHLHREVEELLREQSFQQALTTLTSLPSPSASVLESAIQASIGSGDLNAAGGFLRRLPEDYRTRTFWKNLIDSFETEPSVGLPALARVLADAGSDREAWAFRALADLLTRTRREIPAPSWFAGLSVSSENLRSLIDLVLYHAGYLDEPRRQSFIAHPLAQRLARQWGWKLDIMKSADRSPGWVRAWADLLDGKPARPAMRCDLRLQKLLTSNKWNHAGDLGFRLVHEQASVPELVQETDLWRQSEGFRARAFQFVAARVSPCSSDGRKAIELAASRPEAIVEFMLSSAEPLSELSVRLKSIDTSSQTFASLFLKMLDYIRRTGDDEFARQLGEASPIAWWRLHAAPPTSFAEREELRRHLQLVNTELDRWRETDERQRALTSPDAWQIKATKLFLTALDEFRESNPGLVEWAVKHIVDLATSADARHRLPISKTNSSLKAVGRSKQDGRLLFTLDGKSRELRLYRLYPVQHHDAYERDLSKPEISGELLVTVPDLMG